MALVQCPSCGHACSKKAASCPQCAHPFKRTSAPKKSSGCLLVSLLILIGGSWLGIKFIGGVVDSYTSLSEHAELAHKDRQETEKLKRIELVKQMNQLVRKTPDQVLDAKDLLRYYKSNEVRADQEIKGKLLCVRGTVNSVGREIMGGAYLAFDGPDDEYGLVQCLFNEDEEKSLADVSARSTRTVCGEGGGLMMNVLVKNCHLIEE